MNPMLPARDRERLAKLPGMPGSAHSGERDAAGLAAHRLVQQHGLTWQNIFESAAAKRTLPEVVPWRVTVARCLERRESLNAWEVGCLRGLPRFPRPSAKQCRILNEIADRVLAGAANE